MARPRPPAPAAPAPKAPPPANRAEFAQRAVREALLDVVWSNLEIPRAMRGQVSRGGRSSAYSKRLGDERVLIGSELRPSWPAAAEPARGYAAEPSDGSFGARPEFSAESEAEFLRMHTLRQYGHFLYSDDDMPKLAARAKGAGADPAVFGLLETIRAERRMGIAMGRSFNWENFYPASESEALPPAQRPLFHWLRDGCLLPTGDLAADAKIEAFYDRLLGAADSEEVISLAKEWVEELFPQISPPPQPGEDGEPDGEPQQGKSAPQPGEGSQGQPGEGGPGADGSEGEGPSPAGAEGAGDSEPSEPKESKPSEPKDGNPSEPKESKPSEPKDGKSANEAAPDPYGLRGERQPGTSSMLEQILAGQARDAREEAKAAHKGEAPPKGDGAKGRGGKGEGAKGRGGKGEGAKGDGEGTLDVPAPTGEEARSERSGHGYSEGTCDGSGEAPAPGEWRTDPANVELLEGSTDFFRHGHFHQDRERVDPEQVLRARRIIERMLTGQSRTVLTDSPAKRISTRHLAQGLVKYSRKDDFSRGAMHMDIVVDCSGSMRGQPIDSARCLLTALSELSAKGLVHGRAIFSSGQGWMACPLPMKADKIARVRAFSGSEGIERALMDNVRKLREADAVFVFTDAQITDRSFSKADLKARKVEPMGLYVGNSGAEGEMARYFDRYLIRPTLEDLCLGMVQRFLTQKKLVASTQRKKAAIRR